MLNVGKVILSPRFAQAFTVYRQNGGYVKSRWKAGTEQPLTFYGAVYPATMQDVYQTPEGDRIRGEMVFCSHADAPLYTTRAGEEAGTSDQVEWHGERYKIMQVTPWRDFGYYKAIAVRMSGK